MAFTAKTVFRDFVVDGVPSSGVHEPKKDEIIRLFDQQAAGASAPAVIKGTLAELQAVTPASESYGGTVLSDPDPANNGYYYREENAWIKGRGFSDTFARLILNGSSPNAQTAVASTGVSPADIEVFFAYVDTANTGPMTLSVDGDTPRSVVNLVGNALSPGEWSGVVIFARDGNNYRLLIDAASSASAAQSATDAGVEADRAEQAVADAVAMIIPDDGVTFPKLAPEVQGMVRVRFAATSNVAISNQLENGDELDGVTLAAGNLVLLTAQSSPSENGIYRVVASGAASRAAGLDEYASFPGLMVSVAEGIEQSGTLWQCSAPTGGVLGTTPLTFRRYEPASAYGLDNVIFDNRILGLIQSESLGRVLFLGPNGSAIHDSFETLDGVDLMLSSGADTAEQGVIKNQLTGTDVQIDAGGNSSATQNYTMFSRSAALLNGVTVSKIGVYSLVAATMKLKVVAQTSSTAGTITDLQTVNHPGTGWVDFTLVTPYVVPASGNHYLGIYSAATIGRTTSATMSRFSKIGDNTGATTGMTQDTGNVFAMRYTHSVSAQNLTLVSKAVAADAVPASIRCAIVMKHGGGLNSDVIFSVSRNNRTSWSQASLVELYDFDAEYTVFDTGLVDVSGQPAGTALAWRLQTSNGALVEADGVAMWGEE